MGSRANKKRRNLYFFKMFKPVEKMTVVRHEKPNDIFSEFRNVAIFAPPPSDIKNNRKLSVEIQDYKSFISKPINNDLQF